MATGWKDPPNDTANSVVAWIGLACIQKIILGFILESIFSGSIVHFMEYAWSLICFE